MQLNRVGWLCCVARPWSAASVSRRKHGADYSAARKLSSVSTLGPLNENSLLLGALARVAPRPDLLRAARGTLRAGRHLRSLQSWTAAASRWGQSSRSVALCFGLVSMASVSYRANGSLPPQKSTRRVNHPAGDDKATQRAHRKVRAQGRALCEDCAAPLLGDGHRAAGAAL